MSDEDEFSKFIKSLSNVPERMEIWPALREKFILSVQRRVQQRRWLAAMWRGGVN